MNNVKYCAYLVTILTFYISCNALEEDKNLTDERIKISIREAGNRLLLTHGDSTSLILPVEKISAAKYLLRFKNNHSFEPNTIVNAVKEGFKKGQIPQEYIVQVIQCADNKVAYSYQMHRQEEKTIIPCAGRALPSNCYLFEFRFLESVKTDRRDVLWFALLIPIVLVVIIGLKKRKNINLQLQTESYNRIGSFKFYPKENKLIKETEEFTLTKKECELLSLLIAHPNEVINREVLTKKIWEDNGVIVGRSLDTYISKLRKKLASDTTIKITNIHGVGYKLELLSSGN
ncbi:winged helix-turn-helix domain-containing protein [uncultured Croceitalea sp.]|uniref:winged helix-turn-helix domain-containing protein n=1 Tax=uncultured Croceitalea sp. TaxID=1798908 RepID=UPI003305B720